jgi:hypothetical protein
MLTGGDDAVPKLEAQPEQIGTTLQPAIEKGIEIPQLVVSE